MKTSATIESPLTWLTAKDAAAYLRCSTRQIWKLTACGKLPKPVRISRQMPRWNRTEIEQAIEQLSAK